MSTAKSSAPSLPSNPELSHSFNALIHNYRTSVPARLKLIDVFLVFLMISGILQFAYRLLITSYPYHAFLGSFGSTVGQFVLLAGLRAQVAPGRDEEFKQVSQERAFADFCAASVVLHVFAYNFLG